MNINCNSLYLGTTMFYNIDTLRYFSFVVNESSTKMAASFHLFVIKKAALKLDSI